MHPSSILQSPAWSHGGADGPADPSNVPPPHTPDPTVQHALEDVRQTLRTTSEILARAQPTFVHAPASEPATVELLYDCSATTILGWNNVLIFLTRSVLTPDDILNTEAAGLKFAARHPEGYVLLSVAKAGAPLPDSRTREMSSAMMARLRKGLLATAFVYEGEGFRAAGLRAAVTGVMTAANLFSGHKMQMFSTVGDAAIWLRGHCRQPTWQAHGLQHCISDHQKKAA